jgi:hypothetical protein
MVDVTADLACISVEASPARLFKDEETLMKN